MVLIGLVGRWLLPLRGRWLIASGGGFFAFSLRGRAAASLLLLARHDGRTVGSLCNNGFYAEVVAQARRAGNFWISYWSKLRPWAGRPEVFGLFASQPDKAETASNIKCR